MDEKLNSYHEVEGLLGGLRSGAYPASETENLTELIRRRVEQPVLPVLTVFRPVFATAFVLAVVGALLWGLRVADNLPFKNRQESRFSAREIDVHSIIVGRSGGGLEMQKLEINPGDSIVTDTQSSLTVYFPKAGYIHLPKETNFLLSEGKQNVDTGRMSYAFLVADGSLYAKLPEFEPGSLLTVKTPAGFVRVTGTDFLLDVKKDGSTSVSVLSGSVETGPIRKPEEARVVKSGFHALILSDSDGTLLMSELKAEEQLKLKAEFERVFGETVAHDRDLSQKKRERNIKILQREDD